MSTLLQLDCIAPRLLGPVPATLADAVRTAGEFPNLAWLLARANSAPAAGDSAESLLANCIDGLPAPGPLVAAGHGLAPDSHCYRAAPVHLRADRDRLLLFAGEALEPDPEDALRLVDEFNAAFAEDGLSLTVADGDWLLFAKAPPGPDLPPLTRVAGQYMDTVLPTDAAARPWRQLLNEVQMMLHEHPVNQAREARGEAAINGLWFWGGGPSAAPAVPLPGAVIGTDALSRGLTRPGDAALAGIEALAGHHDAMASSNPAGSQSALMVWTDAEAALTGGDAPGWLDALQRFERDVAGPLAPMAARGQLGLRLFCGNGLVYTLGAGARWRFWRRPGPLAKRITRE